MGGKIEHAPQGHGQHGPIADAPPGHGQEDEQDCKQEQRTAGRSNHGDTRGWGLLKRIPEPKLRGLPARGKAFGGQGAAPQAWGRLHPIFPGNRP